MTTRDPASAAAWRAVPRLYEFRDLKTDHGNARHLAVSIAHGLVDEIEIALAERGA